MISFDHDLSGLPDPHLDAQFYEGVAFKRFIAWVIDVVILVLIFLAATIATLGLAAVFGFLIFVLNFAYRVYFLNKKSATVGMMIAGIEIRNKHGNRLNQQEAMWHTGLYMFNFLVFPLLLLSLMMTYLTSYGQGLHDYVLGTTAINKPMDL
ncbi:hypothetical protein GCM10008927_04360 [Amylibacter ulvae]|uniref:RDD domain-containing protein n=1 Tax=Paramylibacter ulvae TaxID=1651968 RepID=A0ABQ3CU14_9RHOB|nr:RDD family protein [Amylibacter ulvae]GHA42946.1 hypothetical protein GCM10008927_04360 [Amylibacter ulvae]